MSKNIMIPTSRDPFVVMVNGKKYSYKAGQIYSVPDEVAAVIESHIEMQPKPTLFGNTAVEREAKKNYAITDALSRNDLTVVPWREDLDDWDGTDDSLFEYLGITAKSNIILPPTMTIIKQLYNNNNYQKPQLKVDNVWIPNTVTEIDTYAFIDCYGYFVIPTSVKRIGYHALRAAWNYDEDHEYEGIPTGDLFPLTIDLTEFKTEPFPTMEDDEMYDTTVKVCKGRKAELQAMTNWAGAIIEEV